MDPAAREAQYENLMRLHPYLTFKELAERLGVSEMTIRRDLAKRPPAAGVKVAVGGLINTGFTNLDVRMQQHLPQKQAIGNALARFISPGQTLFLDSGSTTYYCLEAIREIPELTFITYDARHLSIARSAGASCYVVGGHYDAETHQISGPLAEAFLKKFKTNVAIIACSGISPEGKLMCNLSHEVPMKQILLAQADRRILVVDSSKFTRQALFEFGDLSHVETVIADQRPPDSIARQCRRHNVKMIAAS